jgi:hypothetical protein
MQVDGTQPPSINLFRLRKFASVPQLGDLPPGIFRVFAASNTMSVRHSG